MTMVYSEERVYGEKRYRAECREHDWVVYTAEKENLPDRCPMDIYSRRKLPQPSRLIFVSHYTGKHA